MRASHKILIFLGGVVGLLGGCGDDPSTVGRVSAADLKALLDKNAAVTVDVRDVQSYAQQHIKGAISMPLNEIAGRLNELPRNKKIVTYCA